MKNTFFTLFRYEFKKIFMSKLTVALLAVMTVYAIVQGIFQTELNSDYASETAELRKAIDGRMIDDKLLDEMTAVSDEYGTIWNESNCTYEGLAGWVRSVVDYGRPLADYDADTIYRIREENMEEAIRMSCLTDSESDYWDEVRSGVTTPFEWHSYDEMYGLVDIVSASPVIMLFVITLGLGRIFAGEISDKTDPIIRCTIGGGTPTYAAKYLAAFVYAAISYILTTVLAILVSFLLWGSAGADGMVQLLVPFAPMEMTIGELFVRLLVTSVFTAVLLTAVTAFVSQMISNPIAVIGIVLGGFFVILAGARSIPYSVRFLSQILFLISPMDMNSMRVLYEFRLIGWDGHYLTAWQFAPVLYLTISVVLIAAGWFVYTRKNREYKSLQ